jgi:hypothetical protein
MVSKHKLVQKICELQSPGGAFLSQVFVPGLGEVEDHNLFITAHVLRETRAMRGNNAALDDARRRAFGFLMRSKYPAYAHSYAFYPYHYHPFWMNVRLYPDADDTCIINLELIREGKRPAEIFTFVTEHYLSRYRVVDDLVHHLTKPWHYPGVFLTWFSSAKNFENPIDCCVNTNVVAFLAEAGLKDTPGYTEACQMINETARSVAGDVEALRQFTPYYPHPVEWLRAVQHAIACGATELLPAHLALSQLSPLQAALISEDNLPLFSDISGEIFWISPVLTHARLLNSMHIDKDIDKNKE